jgi:uncharacterized membrane protein HdeD (DUF308 family)
MVTVKRRHDMAAQMINQDKAQFAAVAMPESNWLKRYYFSRFAFSAVWVVLAFSIAKNDPSLAAVMLVGYPLWDAVANFVDARQSGGLMKNKAQLLNFVVSIVTGISVALALQNSNSDVLKVFGIWAGFSGVLQLAAAVGRWKTAGAQWAMILSGVQSTLASAFMIKMAYGSELVGIANIAPYAAFGAFYFLVSSVSLMVSDALKKRALA